MNMERRREYGKLSQGVEAWPRPSLRGFTLIELLVVIAIIVILAAILVPAVKDALARGQQAGCLSTLRTLVLGHQSYALEHEGNIFGRGDFLSDYLAPGRE